MLKFLSCFVLLVTAYLQSSSQTICTGSPEAGAIQSSTDSICSGVDFTLFATGASVADSGLQYQWQSSLDNVSWQAIASGTTDSITVSQLEATYYRRIISCGELADTSLPLLVHRKRLADCYCVPAAAVCSSGPMIRVLKFGTLNNISFCSPNGYGDYSVTQPAKPVYIGISNPIAVTVSHSGTEAVSLWIDYNHNSIFEPNEYTRIGSGDAVTLNALVNVPSDALPGITKMRIRVKANTHFNPNESCLNVPKGETEDYAVTLVTPDTCSGTPEAGNAVSAVAAACPADSILLSVEGCTINQAGLSYQWQSSTDSINWEDITGQTRLSALVYQDSTRFYRRQMTCSGLSSFSTPVKVTIKTGLQCYCTPANSNCSQNDYIGSVAIGAFTKISNCSPGGYIDYSDSVAPAVIYPGPLNVAVSVGPGGTQHVAAWIDFDRNGSFEAGEFFYIGTGNGVTISQQIQIPANVTGGVTRMRIRVQFNAIFTAGQACSNFLYGETEDYAVNIDNPVHCVPDGASDCSSGDVITRVQFGTMDTTTACSVNGYGDFTAAGVQTAVNAGSYVPVTVQADCVGINPQHVGIWIDFNHNNQFDRSEFTMVQNDCGAILTDSISIPANAFAGLTTMRVRSTASYWFSASDACAAFTTGETEDYTIDIIPAACPVNTWTGLAGNNSWEDAGNWSCGLVPTRHSNVVVNSGSVIINSNVTVYSLTVNAAATVSVEPGFTLQVTH